MSKEKIKLYFVTGLIALLPLVVTLAVLAYVYHILFNILEIFPTFNLPYNLGILINVILFLVFILIFGMFMDHYLGKKIHSRIEERIVSKIPGIRLIYGSTKQLIGAISERQKKIFLKAVFVEYPRKGLYSIGFITQESERIDNKDMVGIIIPTPPNPFTGPLIYVNKSEVIDANISVKDAIKIVTFGGIIGKENQ